MRWIRSHIWLGSRLALFGLAIQVVVSFGHIHLDGRALIAARSIATAQADGSRVAAPAPPIDRTNKAPDPCAICALIQLASTSPPAAAPVLPPLVRVDHAAPQTRQFIFLAASPHFAFQARAPPSV